jgi:hypothetical protein
MRFVGAHVDPDHGERPSRARIRCVCHGQVQPRCARGTECAARYTAIVGCDPQVPASAPLKLIQTATQDMPDMPDIIRSEDCDTWLRRTPVKARALLRTVPPTLPRSHAVSPRIISWRAAMPLRCRRLGNTPGRSAFRCWTELWTPRQRIPRTLQRRACRHCRTDMPDPGRPICPPHALRS